MTIEGTRKETQSVMISVIIPVYNGSDFLSRSLEAVTATDYPLYECIVVNDGSTDGSETIARRFPVKVLELPRGPFGPAYARNRGAKVARGKILFFVDADIVLAPGAVHLVGKIFEEQPNLAGVFGSYDKRPQAKGVVSQYWNLRHHFVHQEGNPDAFTFWAGCGAIRRSVFEEIGGFDEKRFPRSSIEDIELGYRLRKAGHRILLEKALQGTHLKRWTLRSVIRTDIRCRAIPWARLILESKKVPNDLNLKRGQRVSVVLVMLAFFFVVLGVFQVELLTLAAAALLGVVILNRELYLFFFRQHGPFFLAACIPLHLLYYLYSGLSYSFVWLEFHLRGAATHVYPTPSKKSQA